MEEEENRDVDDEGGKVLSGLSVVVNSKIVFSFCADLHLIDSGGKYFLLMYPCATKSLFCPNTKR